MEAEPNSKKKRPFQGDLWRAISPIYYIGKVCGLVPVRFTPHTSEGCQARLNCIDLVYGFCVLILLLGAEIWGLWRDLKDGWEHSTRLKSRTGVVATCSDVLGVMSLTVVCIVASPFRWKYLQLVVKKLIEVDERIGVSSASKARRFAIGLMTCSLGYLWINSALDFYTWKRKTEVNSTMTGKGPINYAPLYFMYTVIISTEIQYTVSTYNVEQRFVQLNSSLGRLFISNGNCAETAEDTGQKNERKIRTCEQLVLDRTALIYSRKFDGKFAEKSGKTYANRIRELTMVHSSLCDAVAFINYTFGVVILAVTVTCLLHLVITPYFLILQAGEKHEWIFLLVQGGWCIFHITRMLIIIQPSYSTVAEGKQTAVLVSQLLCRSFDASARRELEIFSLQLLHRPLEFSACGLFSLDRTLITSIAGVVTTYLVILMQFQNADDTKSDVDIIRNATQILRNASPLQNLTVLKSIAREAI